MLNVKQTPMSSTNILSRPTGPRELLTMLAMDDAAMTAERTADSDKITSYFLLKGPGTSVNICTYSVILFSEVHRKLATPSDHDSVFLSH